MLRKRAEQLRLKKENELQKGRGARNEQSSANTHSVQYFIVENVKRKKIAIFDIVRI
jgi:hypothetical protein